MDISPNALRKETVSTLKEVDSIIESIKCECQVRDIDPEDLRDHHGSWVMSPLLLAKATCLSTLVQLNEK